LGDVTVSKLYQDMIAGIKKRFNSRRKVDRELWVTWKDIIRTEDTRQRTGIEKLHKIQRLEHVHRTDENIYIQTFIVTDQT